MKKIISIILIVMLCILLLTTKFGVLAFRDYNKQTAPVR